MTVGLNLGIMEGKRTCIKRGLVGSKRIRVVGVPGEFGWFGKYMYPGDGCLWDRGRLGESV